MTEIWVVSQDRELRQRWEPAFLAEDWTRVFLSSLSEFEGVVDSGGASRVTAVLLDADLLSGAGEKALAGVRRGLLRFIVFGRRERHGDEAAIRWLNAGADDYLDAASDPRLLVAKLRAHLRRAPPAAAGAVLWSPRKQIKLEPARRSAWRRAGSDWKELPRLTGRECSLLTLFLRQPGRVLDRRIILEQVWGDPGADVNPETVDKHVESLRRKLGAAGKQIHTLYGSGYAFRED